MSTVQPFLRHEILMVSLDENGRPRYPSVLSEPRRKVARAVVMARRLVDPARIGPDAEITDVQHIVEANSERCLEGEHVLIKTVHGLLANSCFVVIIMT
jgi:hypothetical protein